MTMYEHLRDFYHRLKFYRKINWIKTLYFNFKKFPFSTAVKLPVYFYGKVKFTHLSGKVVIEGPIKRGMIGFGQRYEKMTRAMGIAEINLVGEWVFKGSVQFGLDCFVYIGPEAYCEMGHLSSLGTRGKIICAKKVILGACARIGYESQIVDTSAHQMLDTVSGEKLPMTGTIELGNYNFVGNRCSIYKDTQTPDYCTVASNSLTNKNYKSLGENIVIGGIPARLLKKNITRDWVGEQQMLEKYLIVKY